MRMKLIIFTIMITNSANSVFASDNFFRPRASLGYGESSMKIIDATFDASYSLIELGGAYIVGQWYGDLSLQTSLGGEAKDDIDLYVGDADYTTTSISFTVGKSFSPNSSLFAGYRTGINTYKYKYLIDDGFNIFSVNNTSDYEQNGLFLGGSFGFLLGENTSLALSLAVMPGNYTVTSDDNFFGKVSDSGSLLATSIGANFLYQLTSNQGLTARFGFVTQTFKKVSFSDKDIDETIYNFTLSWYMLL